MLDLFLVFMITSLAIEIHVIPHTANEIILLDLNCI